METSYIMATVFQCGVLHSCPSLPSLPSLLPSTHSPPSHPTLYPSHPHFTPSHPSHTPSLLPPLTRLPPIPHSLLSPTLPPISLPPIPLSLTSHVCISTLPHSLSTPSQTLGRPVVHVLATLTSQHSPGNHQLIQ